MIFKPRQKSPPHRLGLRKSTPEAGLPDGVFNVLPGVGARTGQYLTEHPASRKSPSPAASPAAKGDGRLPAASSLKEVTMELGGKSADCV